MDTKAVREVLAKMSTGWKSQRMACQSSDKYYTHELVMNGPDGPRENILWTKEDCDGVAFLRNNAAAWLDAIDRLTRELAEVRRERDALLRFAKDVATQFDHDNDAHRYGTQCRACDAQKLLAAQQRPTDQ